MINVPVTVRRVQISKNNSENKKKQIMNLNESEIWFSCKPIPFLFSYPP